LTNHLQSLNWFLSHPRIAFSVRFGALSVLIISVLVYGLLLALGVFDLPLLPVWVFVVWLGLMGLASGWAFAILPREKRWLNQMRKAVDALDFVSAKNGIVMVDADLALSPVFKIRFALLKAAYFREQSNALAAYEVLLALKASALLPKEVCRVDYALASLFLEQGDLKAVRKTLERLKTANCQAHEATRMILLESRWCELSGDMTKAKELLEEGLAIPNLDGFSKVIYLHQLALLESTQVNYQTALSYYHQAWSLLVSSPKAIKVQQIANTASNLVFLHLRLGDVAKAQAILSAFAERLNPQLASQMILLHNVEIEFARQTGDRKRLLVTYAKAEQQIYSLLDEQEQLAFMVLGLRMRWNDCVEFEAALIRTMQMLIEHSHKDLRNVFHANREVVGVLGQAITRLGPRSDLLVYHGWIVMEWVRLQAQLDEERNAVPAALPALRSDWLGLSLEGMKLRFNLFGRGLPKAEFDRLFALLAERKRIWSDRENPFEQMQALVVIVDEYLAYSREINDPQFKADFLEIAIQALKDATTLLMQHETHPAFTQYMAGMAYFYSQFEWDKTQAKAWLEQFDAKGQSLNHYAVWLREHYQVAQSYVSKA